VGRKRVGSGHRRGILLRSGHHGGLWPGPQCGTGRPGKVRRGRARRATFCRTRSFTAGAAHARTRPTRGRRHGIQRVRLGTCCGAAARRGAWGLLGPPLGLLGDASAALHPAPGRAAGVARARMDAMNRLHCPLATAPLQPCGRACGPQPRPEITTGWPETQRAPRG
jgi:hypothetical protein